MLIDKHLDWTNRSWLWADDCEQPNQYLEFEYNISLNEPPAAPVVLGIACRGQYRLSINDSIIHNGPCREVPPYISYDVFDLQTHLHTGANTISVLVHHGGVNHQSAEACIPGIMFWGDQQSVFNFSNPDSWRCAYDQRYLTSWRLGGCLGWAEHMDLTSDKKSSALEPTIIGQHPCEPSPILLPRNYPALGGKQCSPIEISEHTEGLLCTFAHEVFGFVHLAINCEQAQDIQIEYAEELTEHNTILHKQGMDYRDRLSIAPGRTHYLSFNPRAMRYCLIKGNGLSVEQFHIEEHLYPFTNKDLVIKPEDTLFCEISERSIRLCSEDLQVDCPWRERGQYLDHYAIIGSMHRLFGDVKPIKKWLHQSARGCKHLGYLPMCYPSAPSQGVIPDFQAVYALALRKYVGITDDIETARACLPAACTAITDLASAINKNGLLDEVPGWLFIDNSFQLPRRPCSAGLNANYAGALRAIAELYAIIGDDKSAEQYQARYQQVRSAFRSAFLTERGLKDALVDFGPWQWWNHHAVGSELCTASDSGAVTIQAKAIVHKPITQLAVAHYSACHISINNKIIYDAQQHGGWSNPPLDTPQTISCSLSSGDEITVRYAHSGIDWEVYLASDGDLEWEQCSAQHNDSIAIPTNWRPYERPRLSQVTVGLAAQHGMLEENEAINLLQQCLVKKHYENWRKRTTPVFCEISDNRETLRNNVLPSNTPWAFFPFCSALRDFGMLKQAQSVIRTSYQHLIDRGASTWWEEWNNGSSLCHAWGAFIAEFLIEDEN